MMHAATASSDRRSASPTTTSNTFAATARDDPTGLIGMGASGTGALRRTTKVAWGGVSGGHLPPHRNGGGQGKDTEHSSAHRKGSKCRGNPAVVVPSFKGVGIKVPDYLEGRKTVQAPGHTTRDGGNAREEENGADTKESKNTATLDIII